MKKTANFHSVLGHRLKTWPQPAYMLQTHSEKSQKPEHSIKENCFVVSPRNFIDSYGQVISY